MAASAHVLFIRMSSLGDVALSVPVLKEALRQNPQLTISVLSKPFHAPLFSSIDRLEFIPFDTVQYKGITGIYRFCKTVLFHKKFTHLIDAHDVLRSQAVRFFYFFRKIKIAVFKKGRNEKIAWLKSRDAHKRPLPHATERYAAAFEKLGFTCTLQRNVYVKKPLPKDRYTIGISPLSKHFTKNYPLAKMEKLVAHLVEKPNVEVKILCSIQERPLLAHLCKNQRVSFLAEGSDFTQELLAMKALDLVVSMDSANMHLASNLQVPVLSIWGGTHPDIGFGAYPLDSLQIQRDLPCRPCSVYGRMECPLGHFQCMEMIEPEEIAAQIFTYFNVSI